MFNWAPFSIKFFDISIAGDSLVSLVLALKANPRIEIFFPEIFPNNSTGLDRVLIVVVIVIQFCYFGACVFICILSTRFANKYDRNKIISEYIAINIEQDN